MLLNTDDCFSLLAEDPLQDIGLDRFLARNTSEDNISFVEIMKEADKKHRLKHAWLYDKEQQQLNVRPDRCDLNILWIFVTVIYSLEKKLDISASSLKYLGKKRSASA